MSETKAMSTSEAQFMWSSDVMPEDPTLMSLGVDLDTDRSVLVPFNRNLLVSGNSGSGMSWAVRPLMATARARGNLLLIDPQGAEAKIWSSACHTVTSPEDVVAAIDMLYAKMLLHRRTMNELGTATWEGRQSTFVIEDGVRTLSILESVPGRIQRLTDLVSMGCSYGLVSWWTTSNPRASGSNPGVPRVAEDQLETRFLMRTARSVNFPLVLGDDAEPVLDRSLQESDWRVGSGYLKGHGASPIHAWAMNDDAVRNLAKS